MKDKNWPLGVSAFVFVVWDEGTDRRLRNWMIFSVSSQGRAGRTQQKRSHSAQEGPAMGFPCVEALWCLQGQWLKTLHLKPDLKTTQITIKIVVAFSCFLFCRNRDFSAIPIKWGAAFLDNCRCTWVSFCIWSPLQQCYLPVGWGTALGFPWPCMSSQGDDVTVLLPPHASSVLPHPCSAAAERDAQQTLLTLLLYGAGKLICFILNWISCSLHNNSLFSLNHQVF